MDWTKTDFGYRAETPYGVYEAHRTPSGRFVFRAAGEADSKPGTLANVKEWAALVDANRAALAADPRGGGPAEVREVAEVAENPYGPDETWDLPPGDAPADPDPVTVSTLPEPTTLESALGTVPTGDPGPHDHETAPHEDPLPADEGDPPGDPVGGGWDPLFPPCAVPRDRRNRPVLSWLAAA